MFHATRNTPTVARGRLVFLGADQHPDSARDQVSCLLVRVGMSRQERALAEPKLGHQGLVAVNQGLPLDPVQGRSITGVASLREHAA